MKKLRKLRLENVLSAIIVAFFGFILLNLTFLLDFLFQSVIDSFVSLLTPVNFNMEWSWFPPIKHVMFVIFIGFISWIIFKSKLKVLYKAVYMTVPVAVILVTIGMFLYPWPVVSYSLCGIVLTSVLYYFYRTKQPWLYYYTVLLVSIILAVFTLSGGEI